MQGAWEQRPVNQLLIGSTIDVLLCCPMASVTRAEGLRQAASGEATMFVRAVLHPLESLEIIHQKSLAN